MTTVVIDSPALRDYLGPDGPWAKDAGALVRKYRMGFKLSETQLAAMVGVTAQAIRSIEAGKIVPRDYLRAAIAYSLGQNLSDIWPPLNRTHVGEIATVL